MESLPSNPTTGLPSTHDYNESKEKPKSVLSKNVQKHISHAASKESIKGIIKHFFSKTIPEKLSYISNQSNALGYKILIGWDKRLNKGKNVEKYKDKRFEAKQNIFSHEKMQLDKSLMKYDALTTDSKKLKEEIEIIKTKIKENNKKLTQIGPKLAGLRKKTIKTDDDKQKIRESSQLMKYGKDLNKQLKNEIKIIDKTLKEQSKGNYYEKKANLKSKNNENKIDFFKRKTNFFNKISNDIQKENILRQDSNEINANDSTETNYFITAFSKHFTNSETNPLTINNKFNKFADKQENAYVLKNFCRFFTNNRLINVNTDNEKQLIKQLAIESFKKLPEKDQLDLLMEFPDKEESVTFVDVTFLSNCATFFTKPDGSLDKEKIKDPQYSSILKKFNTSYESWKDFLPDKNINIKEFNDQVNQHHVQEFNRKKSEAKQRVRKQIQ